MKTLQILEYKEGTLTVLHNEVYNTCSAIGVPVHKTSPSDLAFSE